MANQLLRHKRFLDERINGSGTIPNFRARAHEQDGQATTPATVSIKKTLKADGITISGTVGDMQKVKVTKLVGGGAKVEIDLTTPPKETYN